MARLVARALRINRSALIQSGLSSGEYAHYRLSYLMPALLWPEAVMVVAPQPIRNRLVMVDIPRLQQWMNTHKPIHVSLCASDSTHTSIHSTGDWPQATFKGLFITSPQQWLSDRLHHRNCLPAHVPTIMDGVDDLEQWIQDQLTVHLHAADWDALMLACPSHRDTIRDVRIKLTRSIFQHPPNPYRCNVLDEDEQNQLRQLDQLLQVDSIATEPNQLDEVGEASSIYRPKSWSIFFDKLYRQDQLLWTNVQRQQGQFALHATPLDVASVLEPVWSQQPFVLIGNTLDQDAQATAYRPRLGLGDITCLQFAPARHHDLVQLYLPDRFPLPNTPQFQPALLQELRQLLCTSAEAKGLTVILVGDVPLKAQIATTLASEFGSRLQVEQTCLDENGILVSGWKFWHDHHMGLPLPTLLVIPTLPIPSLEDPLVAARVSRYKKCHQNWFTDYLLPETLKSMQRAIAPLRNTQGVIALLDNRVNYRSYGNQVLDAMSPFARINYVDEQLFSTEIRPVLDER